MKSKWYLISSIFQALIGLIAIIFFIILAVNGEVMTKWIITLFLAIVASIVPYDFILAIFTPFTLLTSGMMGLWYIQPGLSMIIIVFLSLGIFGILILIT